MPALGSNNRTVGPERYLGRYTNNNLSDTAWTILTSLFFKDATSPNNTELPDGLQFLTITVSNLGAVPLYLLVGDAGTTASYESGIYIPASVSNPLVRYLDVGAILPTPTQTSPTGIRTISICPEPGYFGNVIIEAGFAGLYGP